ncbi:MAG: VIT1/CCC1 transporter family protein [Chloroflexota bacterium]
MLSNFLRGFIDGALSTLGVVIGASSASSLIIISAGIGGTVANAISNLLSAFSAESATRYAGLRDLEKSMVDRKLKGSILDRRIQWQTLRAGGVDGLGTFLGGALPVIPYAVLPPGEALFVSIGVVILAISFVGVYLGRVSKSSILLSVLKMVVLGLLVAGLVYLLQRALIPS